jgi:hypothetical protein
VTENHDGGTKAAYRKPTVTRLGSLAELTAGTGPTYDQYDAPGYGSSSTTGSR